MMYATHMTVLVIGSAECTLEVYDNIQHIVPVGKLLLTTIYMCLFKLN